MMQVIPALTIHFAVVLENQQIPYLCIDYAVLGHILPVQHCYNVLKKAQRYQNVY